MNGESRIIFFSRKQKELIGKTANHCYYDGQEFTSNLPSGSEVIFDDAVIILDGVPDQQKFSYK